MFTRKITVNQHERVLVYRDGRFERVLEPGRHVLGRRAQVVRVDVRERIVTLAPQEVLTADGVTLRVTAALVWRVADPLAFQENSAYPENTIYLAAQIGLREALAGLDVDAVLTTGRREVGGAVTSAAAVAGQAVGIGVREAILKDVLLPPDLRLAYAELRVGASSAAGRSSSRRGPRPRLCGRSRTARSCSTRTPRWPSCGSSSRCRRAPR